MNDHKSVEPIATSESHFPQRVVKWAAIAQPGGVITEGALISSNELERLSNWCCRWNLFRFHDGEPDELRKDLVEAGGSCDPCREDASFLLSDCPYIEMNRSAEMRVEDL